MLEHDGTFLEYQHELFRPREAEALQMLRKVASQVKPIMRRRGWKVGLLCEIYLPNMPRLFSLNSGRGQKISLRLRYSDDEEQFLPLEDVVKALLHALCFIVHAKRDEHFKVLLNQLRKEYNQLEQDFLEYKHEMFRPREIEALLILRKVASRLKPIMRRRGWTVGILSEFWPSKRPYLNGQTLNKGQKIWLRLRYFNKEGRFRPFEELVDDMLHELCHIVHDDHDEQFNALLAQLRNEYEQLVPDDPFLEYAHLKNRPREAEALQMLRKVASRARSIMRRRGWKVGLLREVYPSDRPDLFGQNWNRGQRISLRLRYFNDERQFLPFDEVVDVMLHELCHIAHDGHDEHFKALLDQLRSEDRRLLAEDSTRNETTTAEEDICG